MSSNVNTYTDYEIEKYSDFIEYVEDEINKSDLPNKIKRKLIKHKFLDKKPSGMWFLSWKEYEFEFQPFRNWLQQTEREKKLNQLLDE